MQDAECKGSQPTSLGTQANLACPRCTLLINERGSGNPPTRTGPARRVMVRTPPPPPPYDGGQSSTAPSARGLRLQGRR
ncbi:unnamed protein product, partial [Iphiclides podalirius]